MVNSSAAAGKPRLSSGSAKARGVKVGGAKSPRNQFFVMALNMSWQLAIVVLLPVLGGVQLDKAHSGNTWTLVGLGIAVIGSAAVMWRSMQTANRLPVPKLTDAERRAIRKSYEEDDD